MLWLDLGTQRGQVFSYLYLGPTDRDGAEPRYIIDFLENYCSFHISKLFGFGARNLGIFIRRYKSTI